MTIIHRIQGLLNKRNITKEQLSRDAGIDYEIIDNSLSSNIHFKSAIVLSRIAKYFHVSVHWLITGESEDSEREKRLEDLLKENHQLRKETKSLKEFITNIAPCNYDEYLGSG